MRAGGVQFYTQGVQGTDRAALDARPARSVNYVRPVRSGIRTLQKTRRGAGRLTGSIPLRKRRALQEHLRGARGQTEADCKSASKVDPCLDRRKPLN